MSDSYKGTLVRSDDNGHQMRGRLVVYKNGVIVFRCDTLELPWRNNDPVTSCYPPGTYEVVRRTSTDHGLHWHVLVPNRAYRLIHTGNFVGSKNPKTHIADSKGCTLAGLGYQDITGDGIVDLLHSVDTMRAFMKAVPVDSFTLQVFNPPMLA